MKDGFKWVREMDHQPRAMTAFLKEPQKPHISS